MFLKNKKITLSLGLGLLLLLLYLAYQFPRWQKQRQAEQRLETAQAMFAERCKKAGEFIYRTVDDVEGIFLMKVRPENINHGDQFRMDDPYGSDTGGDAYIKNFLVGRDFTGSLSYRNPIINGYSYVETIDSNTNQLYSYAGSKKDVIRKTSLIGGGSGKTIVSKEFALSKSPIAKKQSRYAVTYEDISTIAEREYWITGSSLKVIDTHRNEVIAERKGYMFDPGQGDKAGGRSPWLLAARFACPEFPSNDSGIPVQIHQTRNFVEKVLTVIKD